MNIFFTTRPDHVDKTTSLSRGLSSCVATYLEKPVLFTFGYKGSNGRIFVFFFYGPIEKAVLNPHRHIESSYAWPRPGPSCANMFLKLFFVFWFLVSTPTCAWQDQIFCSSTSTLVIVIVIIIFTVIIIIFISIIISVISTITCQRWITRSQNIGECWRSSPITISPGHKT